MNQQRNRDFEQYIEAETTLARIIVTNEEIEKQKIDKLKWWQVWIVGLLFTGGVLLSGSDWVDFPYGQVIGVPMLLLMCRLANRWVPRKEK